MLIFSFLLTLQQKLKINFSIFEDKILIFSLFTKILKYFKTVEYSIVHLSSTIINLKINKNLNMTLQQKLKIDFSIFEDKTSLFANLF
ncbi:hypothetical protein BpHYR1_028472 [Brachionus plicatilis]|uniref:Uncharacterized protein n=1 Tax=Brachionus plicatilis TaxID=10195 RepID=A0A3M7STG2_BRAPC|nr:hypothetical protein BpHYR1_028472 [Brachionus plicatilis]